MKAFLYRVCAIFFSHFVLYPDYRISFFIPLAFRFADYTISKDLPFAHARFCTTEGIENVIPLSDFRFSDFDENYGVRMADGPLAGLLARSVVVIGKDGKIAYTELVPEITQEPDYDKAIAAVK